MAEYVLRPGRRACEEVLPTSTSNATFASSKIRRLDHTLVANPPPKVGTTSRVRATDGQEPVDPPGRARFASEDDERARAAFAHYAGAKPGTAGAAMPPGFTVLALADLGALEGCDAELVGRYIAESLADEIDDHSPVTYARFKSMCEVIEGRRAAGALGNPRDGEMELVPPELLDSVAMRALFDSYAVDVDENDDTAGDKEENRSARLMTMEAWNGMLLDAGLLAPAGEDLRQTTRAPGALTLAGACVAFARARGPTRSRDASIAHVPDFFAALAAVARVAGVSVGEISCRLLALGPDPDRPSVGKLSSEDYGASAGFRGDPREAFGADAFEADVDDLASTGLSTPDVTRGTRPIFGATDRREAIERARACFRCVDVGHRGFARLEDLPVILGQAGGFDHLDLNAAAVWAESRLGSLAKRQGNIVKYNQFEHEVTLTDVGRHLRAALRYPPPEGTFALADGPVVINEKTVNSEDLAAVANVFERFCAAGAESGFTPDSPPHPKLMDLRRWALCARNACVFDVGFERGAEVIAFARACPPGNHRVDFARFLCAIGWVAKQKGLDARGAVQWFKRAKVSMRPVASKLAEFSVKANPGYHSGVALAAARPPLDSANYSPPSPSSPAASSSGENSPKNANAAPKSAAALPSSSFTATRKAPRADSLRPAVADPASAELVIAAALDDRAGDPLVAATLTMVLADIGALEGLCPNRAGAAVHGAKVSLQLHGDDARVGRDDVVRASMILDELRRSNSATIAPLKPAPARSLKTYEDNPSLRGTYREFATHGMEAEERDRVLRRLDATWQRGAADADADASLLDGGAAGWPKQGSIPRREGVKGAPLQSSCPCGNPRCSSTTHPHATWPIEVGNPEKKPFHPNPVPYQGRELPDRRQMFAEVKPTSLGPDSREVAFLTAVGRRRNFVEARTAKLFETPTPQIDPNTGRTVDGFTHAQATSKIKIAEEHANAEDFAGDRPGTATAPGAAARAAASKQRELLAASRAELEGLDPRERAGREATERGSASAIASRKSQLAAAAESAAETAATRRDVPSSQRCGMSLDNFRKLCAESGVLGSGFTPSAVDVVFARSRAPGSNLMSWGEFLRSIGYVAELRGEKFGIVANKLMAVGKPRTHYAETRREKEAVNGVSAAREGARRGVRMIKPWSQNLRRPRLGNRGELEPMDVGWGHLTGVLTHPVLETPRAAPEETRGVANPRRLKPGALGRSGTRAPKMGMKEFLDSCEASHRVVVARLRRETAAAEAAADEARDASRREFHLREREMMERATRRTNAKDPWHFVKDLETLERAGYTVDGDPFVIGMADTMPSGVHTLTLGKERSETWDERGGRLGATWLIHSGAKNRELPFGVTARDARVVARSDPNVPIVAERDVQVADAFARARVDALVHGTVGARGRAAAGRGGEEGRWAGDNSLRSTGGSFGLDRGFDSRGGRVAGVPSLSAAAVRRTLNGRDRRVDPMASLVRRMREEGAVGGSSAH